MDRIQLRSILGDKIREARKNKSMTQEQLAEELGYGKQTISNWELGKSEVPDDMIEKLNGILETKLSKKAFTDLEEKKMRGSNIKSIEEVDRFEDYLKLFDEITGMVFDGDEGKRAFEIVVKKFLLVAATVTLIERKRGEWEKNDKVWSIVSFKLLQIINENGFVKAECDERSDGIIAQLKETDQFIIDSYNNIFNVGELEELIVLEKRYEETLGEYATSYINDLMCILPKKENSFLTELMVYLIETVRILDEL